MFRYLFGKERDPVSENGYKIDFNSVLGTGGYGCVVYKCKRRNEEFAIKRLRPMDDESYSRIVREIDIWQQLNHENIVKLIQHFAGNKDADGLPVVYQVMKLCECDLKKWFRINTNRTLKSCKEMINEIISGLSYLHSKHIIHRDLKPQNILISFDGICKIADFGITVIHDNTETNAHTDSIGTRLYAAPELFDTSLVGEGKYNLKVDVYSLAIILVEFFTIFESEDQKQVIIKKLRINVTIDDKFFENFDKNKNNFYYYEIKNLIELMINLNPNERPDIGEVQRKLYSFDRKLKVIPILLKNYRIFNQISAQLLWKSKFVFIYDYNKNKLILINDKTSVFEIKVSKEFDRVIDGPKIVKELTDKSIIDIQCSDYNFINFINFNKSSHVICLTENSQVFTWGENRLGQLGNGTRIDNNIPTIVNELNDKHIVSISCGSDHTLAMSSDGNVYSWGKNSFGQLGIGSEEDFISTPTLIQTFPQNDHKITAISCGAWHSMALSENGTVFSWGWNSDGQCGDGSRENIKSVKRVKLENDIVIQKICCGRWHSLLLTSEGDVYSFGGMYWRELGRHWDDKNSRSIATKIACSEKFIDIYSNIDQSISIGLTESQKCFVWGKCGEEEVFIPRETQFESINETIIFYSNSKITPKAIIF